MIVPALLATFTGLLLSVCVTLIAVVTPTGLAGPLLVGCLLAAVVLYGYSHLYRRHRS